MSTAKAVYDTQDATGSPADTARLARLKEWAGTQPERAKEDAWDWLQELQAPSEHARTVTAKASS
jgi:hypothetical protein